MPANARLHLAVAGAGIGGLALARALRREGIHVTVLEKSAASRETGVGLALWSNATRALDYLRILAEADKAGARIHSMDTMEANGRVLARLALPADGPPALCLPRLDLVELLRRDLPEKTVLYGRRVARFQAAEGRIRVSFEGGGIGEYDGLVGADGLHSRVREQLWGDAPPEYAGYTCWRGVAPVAHPPLGLDRVVEVWGGGRRFGLLPLGASRTCWYATANRERGERDLPADRKTELRALFQGWPLELEKIIEATPVDVILRHDIFDRPPLPEWGRGVVTLLGDAAHPMTPNLAQGACTALEDAVVLARCLAREEGVERAFRRYESLRRERTARIVRDARRVGRIAQWQAGPNVLVRRALVSLLPGRILTWRITRPHTYDAFAAAG